jgi:hypothetical protein
MEGYMGRNTENSSKVLDGNRAGDYARAVSQGIQAATGIEAMLLEIRPALYSERWYAVQQVRDMIAAAERLRDSLERMEFAEGS